MNPRIADYEDVENYLKTKIAQPDHDCGTSMGDGCEVCAELYERNSNKLSLAKMLKIQLDNLRLLKGISDEDNEKYTYANWIVDLTYGENITELDAQAHIEVLMEKNLDQLKNIWFGLTE